MGDTEHIPGKGNGFVLFKCAAPPRNLKSSIMSAAFHLREALSADFRALKDWNKQLHRSAQD